MKNFLIIDDELSICKLMELYLSNYAHCFSATNSVEALKIFNKQIVSDPFDVVFMDIMMPGFDGHRLVKMLHEIERKNKIELDKRFLLFIVSAYDDATNTTKSYYDDGALSFIRKPFTEEGLINELHKYSII